MPCYNVCDMKFFSLIQANKALALIRPIVSDVQKKWGEIKKIKEECDAIVLNHLGSESILNKKEDRLDELLEEIENHILELQEVGAEFKGFDEGLIDFPAKIDTRMIYLCWKMGEESVSCWHEIFEGYGGRKSITADFSKMIERENQVKSSTV